MSRIHFGTDGIRGTVGVPPITPDFMLRLGHAVGQVLRRAAPQAQGQPQVLIGKDTRISGYMLESSLEAGFASAGVDVLLSGPLPTPGVAYLTRALRLDLGVVISASHNAFADNGVKFFSARGEKLSDEWEAEVERELLLAPRWVNSAGLGKARRLADAGGRYVEFCKSTVPHTFSLRGVKIVIDAAHGAAYHVAPEVFHELGASIVTIGCSPDGLNINADVGATAPQALVRAVAEHRADYGVALDGDADRLQLVDAQGRLYNGDELLYVMAADRMAQRRPVPGVVGTLMTNLGVEQALSRLGVSLVRAKVGDRYVLEELTRRDWIDQHTNACFIGGSGTGKTHVATSIGVSLCRAGVKVKFTTAASLVTELETAQQQHRLDRVRSALERIDLLIVDELGYLSFSRGGAELLFQVFADRYERRSVLLTSNLPFGEWAQIFQGERMTAALLDRLTHRCHIFEMNGESYRFRESMKAKKTKQSK